MCSMNQAGAEGTMQNPVEEKVQQLRSSSTNAHVDVLRNTLTELETKGMLLGHA